MFTEFMFVILAFHVFNSEGASASLHDYLVTSVLGQYFLKFIL